VHTEHIIFYNFSGLYYLLFIIFHEAQFP